MILAFWAGFISGIGLTLLILAFILWGIYKKTKSNVTIYYYGDNVTVLKGD